MLPTKQRECRTCGSTFSPWSTTQTVCGRTCAAKLVKSLKVAEKAKDKAKKAEQQPLRELVAEAQAAFNEFIRTRDRDQPCISCGVMNPPQKHGGAWDAGHFLSRGSHPELRFDETNVHKQCKGCNGGGGKFSHKARTVGEQYAANLPARIGQAAFDRLMGPHEVCKLDRDVLRQLKVIYRAKTRALKKEQQ